VTSEVSRKRPNGRLIFVGAIAAVLVLTPLVALFARGGKSTDTARAGSSTRAPAPAATADVPHRGKLDPNERPLPKARPTVVDTEAGIPATDGETSDEGVPMEGPLTSPARSGNSRAEIEAEDAEYRTFLRQQKLYERLVEKAPGRFTISYGTGRLAWPLPGFTTISSPFGMRWGRLHAGIDIPAPIGTRIIAADKGTVIVAGPTGGYGNYTCIQHTQALSTCYGHQSRIGVRPGDDVRAGQVIGLSGNTGNSTGPHLHFETRNNGSPFDPMAFF